MNLSLQKERNKKVFAVKIGIYPCDFFYMKKVSKQTAAQNILRIAIANVTEEFVPFHVSITIFIDL